MSDPEYLRLAEALKRTPSMEDVARLREPAAASPGEALQLLQLGNARFCNGASALPTLSPMERRSQVISQTPFAVILGCSDSRVPIEIVFDQGAGFLFITRIVGNVVDASTMGCIEYAVRHLKVHLVGIMGHEGCGAVQAAMKGEEAFAAEPENLRGLLACVYPAVRGLPVIRDGKARMREAVIANVRHQVSALRRNPVIGEACAAGQIAVVGAYYEISSGAVDFLVTDEELRPCSA